MKYQEISIKTTPKTLHFYPDQITLLLDIDKKYINLKSKKDKAEKLGLTEKNDFHFTIIGTDTGKKILKIISQLDEEKKEKMINNIYELAEAINRKAKFKDDFFYIQKEYTTLDSSNTKKEIWEKREAIIQPAEFEGIDEFYKKLNILVGEEFETPWPHITLYTTSTRDDKKTRGIGIYSKKQFEELHPQSI